MAGVEGGEAADQQQQGGASHTAQSELVVITLHYQLSPVTFTGLLLVFSYFKIKIFFIFIFCISYLKRDIIIEILRIGALDMERGKIILSRVLENQSAVTSLLMSIYIVVTKC